MKSMTKTKTKAMRVRPQIVVQKKAKKKEKELTLLGSALRALGGMGGAAVGTMFGNPMAGSAAGTSLGTVISKWLGSGDYSISQNSLTQRVARGSDAIPMMHSEGQSITVRHREYISEIKGSTGFAIQRFFLLQPGDANTFPWLSSLASKFQQYKIKGMVFHYVPTSGYAVSGTNPAIGSVMMQTSYRANDSTPGSKVEMLNEYWANEASPADSFCHPIECDPKENPFSIHYIRTSPVGTNDSPLLYDIGVTYVATSGMPATGNVVGDLWVTYEVELSKPLIASNVVDASPSGFVSGLSPVPGNWFPSTGLTTSGALGVTASGLVVTFPIGTLGTYILSFDIPAATTFSAVDLSGAPTLSNCSFAVRNAIGDSAYIRTVLTGTAPALGRAFFQTAVTLADPSAIATVTLPAGAWTGTAAYCHLSVAEL